MIDRRMFSPLGPVSEDSSLYVYVNAEEGRPPGVALGVRKKSKLSSVHVAIKMWARGTPR